MGYKLAGYDVIGFNELDPRMAKAYTDNHDPTYAFVEDIRTFREREGLPPELFRLDILDGSPPCFTEGTLVMTNDGLKPIEKVKINDQVLTHENRFMPVVEVMQKQVNSLYKLKIQGSLPLEVTGEHPFYIRRMNRRNKKGIRSFGLPEWKSVKDLNIIRNPSNAILEQDYIGVAINQESRLPDWEGEIVGGKLVNTLNFDSLDFWYLIGRWIGDGWTRTFENEEKERKQPKYQPEQKPCKNCGEPSRRHVRYKNQWTAYCSEKCRSQYRRKKRKPNRNDFIICCNKMEASHMKSKFDAFGMPYRVSNQRTTLRFVISSKELCSYVSQFGNRAHNKCVTSDILNLPVDLLQSFLEGYLDADGHFDPKRKKWGCCSVSKKLIYGIQHCIHKVYKIPTSIAVKDNAKYSNKIEGRKVKTRMGYSLQFFKKSKRQQHAFYENGYLWIPFRSKKAIQKETIVYNIGVEGDESYTVNNFICHNCSSFSTVGKRESGWGKKKKFREGQKEQVLDDLFFEFIALAERLRPKVVVSENVTGLLKGRARKMYGTRIMQSFKEIGYQVNYYVLDASKMGVPQKRERVFFIAVRSDIAAKLPGDGTTLFDTFPRLDMGFAEKEIPFSTFCGEASGGHKNGTLEKWWDKVAIGKDIADYHPSGSFFSFLKCDPEKPLPTLTGGGKQVSTSLMHPFEKRYLNEHEMRLGGAWPLDYVAKRTPYIITMSVPPVMMAQVALRIYEQWFAVLDGVKGVEKLQVCEVC